MMKYETPTADVVLFDDTDIITTSGGETIYDELKADPFGNDIYG